MKNSLILIAIAMSLHVQANAQSWSIGAAGIYGDDIKQGGIHLRAYYNLKNDKVCFGPEYSHFFELVETTDHETVTKKLNEINF